MFRQLTDLNFKWRELSKMTSFLMVVRMISPFGLWHIMEPVKHLRKIFSYTLNSQVSQVITFCQGKIFGKKT